jgi:hypothetical protein
MIDMSSTFVQRPFFCSTKHDDRVFHFPLLNAVGRKESYSVILLPVDGIGLKVPPLLKPVLSA